VAGAGECGFGAPDPSAKRVSGPTVLELKRPWRREHLGASLIVSVRAIYSMNSALRHLDYSTVRTAVDSDVYRLFNREAILQDEIIRLEGPG
jgi:hypothetical protein